MYEIITSNTRENLFFNCTRETDVPSTDVFRLKAVFFVDNFIFLGFSNFLLF